MPPQRRVPPRRDPGIACERHQCGRAAAECMLRAHDDGERVIEKVLLHDVLVGYGITQGTDQHISEPPAQGSQHALIGTIQDADGVLGSHARELEDGARDQHAEHIAEVRARHHLDVFDDEHTRFEPVTYSSNAVCREPMTPAEPEGLETWFSSNVVADSRAVFSYVRSDFGTWKMSAGRPAASPRVCSGLM